ncbi:NACHT and ankyrin domain protein [Mycena venus]|uniref:NACHT and ankyrin domain protein n=1 Tax=Mycena venus TaxID=2733690 RepID=A0A8H6WRS2_9AGAR|nr:NACHT and ankyrin domain protein [Mycena venus]
MSDQREQSLTFNFHGGTGGGGGSGHRGGYGGDGGPGHGPTLHLKVEAGTVRVVINHSDRKEEKDIPRQDFLNWLSPINFFLRQADILQVRQEGTGEWLLADPRFRAWKTASRRTLWCHGIPGAGKTVLASIVVDHLTTQSKDKNIGVACLYLNHKEANDQTPSKLLAAIWRQLVYGRDVGSIAKNLYPEHQEKGTALPLKEVLKVLRSSLEEFSQVFLVVDAIDEYPDDQRCILLKHLVKLMGPKVNLMLTSRPHIPADPALPNVETLEIRAMPEDIQKYIDVQIDLSPRLPKHMQKKPQLRENIHKKIIDTVDGMFLLAKLHIESLRTKNSIGAVQEALEELPKSLHDTYDIAMQRIEAQNEDDRRTARSTLIWVANAKRPLEVPEITAALAIKLGSQRLNEDDLIDIETILSVCAGLVVVDQHRKVVRLVHYTTQEYLDSIQAQKFPDAQQEITRTLLTFLTFDGYPDLFWTNYWAKSAHLPPLVEYSQYCLAHAAGQHEGQLTEMIAKFLGQAFQWRGMLVLMRMWDSPPWNYSHWPSQPSALWIAAAANLMETAKFLLEPPLLQHSENPEIIVASDYGHLQMVKLLIESGADVTATGGSHGSTLQAAAARGQAEMVNYLLGKKPGQEYLNHKGGNYGTALCAACANGNVEVVSALLQAGAKWNVNGKKFGTPLHVAVLMDNREMVNLLIGDNPIDANCTWKDVGTAADVAGYIQSRPLFDLLIQKGLKSKVSATESLPHAEH